MDLKSGQPFWPLSDGLVTAFPPHRGHSRCEVLVAGAGITGALITRVLSDAGFDVLVLDARDAAWGSTAASTALLQYEIDTELGALCKRYGEQLAVAAYRACEKAIGTLERLLADTPACAFQGRHSLYVASHPWHGTRIRTEGELRRRHGFAVDILDRGATQERYGIAAAASLLTHVAAQMDPYRGALELLARARDRSVAVHDRTAIVNWRRVGRDLCVQTNRGTTIRCRHLILALGYEAQKHLRARVARNRSSYALVSEPLDAPPAWLKKTMGWESARPYLYWRNTCDGRVLVGGEDDRRDVPARRDRQVGAKAAKLVSKMSKLVPGLEFEPGFAWAGTFAETSDGLPFFGAHAQHGPLVHFAMAYGGNGVVFSMIGAQILRDRLLRRRHPLDRFFSFERLVLRDG